MTSTGPADVVVSAYDRITPGWPAFARPASREPGSDSAGCREPTVAPAVFPGSASGKLGNHRLAGRSVRLRPVCPPLRPQRARVARPPHPPCLRQPVLAHPLYLYLLGRHTAPTYGWSFDPGRDILCILISPPRWLQWP
jgi:hypothetical protein